MGPKTAYNLIKECGSIEKVIEKINTMNEDETKKKKYIIPESFLYE
jgi:5'-3' exonuclease